MKIPGQSIFLRAPDDDMRRHWVDVLQHAVALSKQQHERELAQESGKASASAAPRAAIAQATNGAGVIVDSDASDADS